MNYIDDNLLIETYVMAIEIDVEDKFINLLEGELTYRGIDVHKID